MTQTTLNSDQQQAAKEFLSFLVGEDKGFILSGRAGTGKTYTTAYLVNTVMENYKKTCKLMGIEPLIESVVYTATTNKAAEVLRESLASLGSLQNVSTIHNFMGLRVQDDFATRTTKLTRTNKWSVKKNMLVIIDECSMIDSQLYKFLSEGFLDCKFLFVGDNKQLPPVGDSISPIYKDGLHEVELKIPVRNMAQPALVELCNKFAEAVETGIFPDIIPVPGVIDYLDAPSAMKLVDSVFAAPDNPSAALLGYTNKKTTLFGKYVRKVRGLPEDFTPGETVVSGSGITTRNFTVSAEEKFRVLSIGDPYQQDIGTDPVTGDMVSFRTAKINIVNQTNSIHMNYATDQEHFKKLMSWVWKKGDKSLYTSMKSNYLDLRTNWASTIHKSQGSTYDTVFIDLTDVGSCTQSNLTARLLYVALSRAKTRVVLFGKLPPRYGKVIG